MKFSKQKQSQEIFDGGMSISTLPATFLQICVKTIVNFKVIVKSIIDTDDTF